LRDGAVVAAIIGACVVLLGYLLQYGIFRPDDDERAGAGQPSATASRSPEGTLSSEGTSFPDTESSHVPLTSEPPPDEPRGDGPADREEPRDGGGDGEDGGVPQPGIRYLSNLRPVGGLGNHKSTGPAVMRQKTYGNSVIFSMKQFSPGRKDVTYNVPAGVNTFKATVGLDDETMDGFSVFFQVSRDGNAVDSGFTLRAGETKAVSEDVSGTRHLTISVEGVEAPDGVVNAPCRAVWGDAAFRDR